MMNTVLLSAFGFAAALLVCFQPIAQERTAAGTLDTQMTWSALSNKIGTVKDQVVLVDSKVTALTDRLAKFEACAKKQKLYAAGTAGADAEGCVQTAGGKRWIQQGSFSPTMPGVPPNWGLIQSALQAAGVTRACVTQTSAYPYVSKYVGSQYMLDTSERIGANCATANDRCYVADPHSSWGTYSGTVGVLICN